MAARISSNIRAEFRADLRRVCSRWPEPSSVRGGVGGFAIDTRLQSRGVPKYPPGVAGNALDARGVFQVRMKFASVVGGASQEQTSVEVVVQISQKQGSVGRQNA